MKVKLNMKGIRGKSHSTATKLVAGRIKLYARKFVDVNRKEDCDMLRKEDKLYFERKGRHYYEIIEDDDKSFLKKSDKKTDDKKAEKKEEKKSNAVTTDTLNLNKKADSGNNKKK